MYGSQGLHWILGRYIFNLYLYLVWILTKLINPYLGIDCYFFIFHSLEKCLKFFYHYQKQCYQQLFKVALTVFENTQNNILSE